MRTHTHYLLILTVTLAFAASAKASQWFTVASPGIDVTGTRVEVDLDTVRARGPGGEAVIRVSHDAVQPHSAGFQYRSFVATAQFNCQQRTINLMSASFYAQAAGAGPRVGMENPAAKSALSGRLLDSVPGAAKRALLRATCATTHTSSL